MQIGILQCDSVDTNLQPQFGDYPDMFQRLLTADPAGPELMFRTYDLTSDQFPQSGHECDAWLITGSKWSAYDTDAWIIRAHEFVRELHAHRRPTIGVCFGHQLIARALGGTVEKAAVGWGVGVHTANIDQQRPWMVPQHAALTLPVSHQDQVIEPPAGAMLLAGHAFCPYDMLEIDGHMLTMQGHPEFAKGYARALMDKRHDALGDSVYKTGIASLEQRTDAGVAARWMHNFLAAAAQA